jgi:signal transduction histidine kinase/ligand-binding sensor domain-containing protein
MKDKQGFLWIATANGLNRYDGMEMKVYKPAFEEKKGQMQGRIIRSEMLEDEQEQIWFSTDLTVHCFKKKSETFVTYNLSGKKNAGIGIFANPLMLKDGHLWLASASGGLFDLNTATKDFVQYPLTFKDESGNYIQLMYNGVHDGKGRLWFASSKGLISFDMMTRQWRRHFRDKVLYSISFSQDTLFVSEGKEILWIEIKTLQSGMAKFNESGSEIARDPIHRVYTDKKFNIWAGDEKGNVFCRSARSAEFRWMGNINLGGTIRTNYPVYCFYADTSGILWVGAYMLGLLKAEVKRQEFSVFPKPEANRVNENIFVNAIYENEKDEVWLGTFQKGIIILDKNTGKTSSVQLPYTGPQLFYGNSIHLIYADSKGNLWTGMSGYLFVREKGTASFTGIKIPVPSNALQNPQVWNCTEYKEGWLFGTNIGLYFVSKEKKLHSVKHLPAFGQKRITAIWKNDYNEVWLALESGGVIIAKDPEISTVSKKLFTETNIKAFHHDKRHELLWIATSNGLIAWHLLSGRYKYFAEKDGLLNSYAYGILQDADRLWISTNYGLYRAEIFFKKDSILPDATFTNFTSSDGLPDNQFNNLAFYKGQSNNFYFGTSKGLVWFNPSTIRPNMQPVTVRMIDLLINEKKLDSAVAPEYITDLSIPYYQNNLFFRFRGIDYTNPSKVSYAYKMEGWDDDWIYSNQLHEERYSNLPPGKYQFKIRAANSSGVWNKDTYSVVVNINPPFWKTWWFYTLSAAVIVLTIIIITRFLSQQKLKIRVAELEKQKEIDKERQRISREMHDDIGAGLTQITLMTESVKQKAGIHKQKELDDIAGTSRKLVGNMSEIIWSLNPENKTINHLMAYLREQLNKLLEYAGLEYSILLPESNKDILLTNEQRRNILLATKEIVNNVIKHSHAKLVIVKSFIDNNRLSFEIGDDGKGFDLSKKYSGNGLHNIRHRVEELKGNLIIDSQPGKGARFIFSIPLGSTT